MRRLAYLATALAAALLLALVLLCDTVVIETGIRTWRLFATVVGIVLVLCAVASIVLSVQLVLRVRKTERERAEEEVRKREADAAALDLEHFLSSKRAMDPGHLRRALVTYAADWKACENELNCLARQFLEMDRLQEQLERFIRQNGGVTFAEATDLFLRMEQNICKNARSCLNLMTVSDANDPEAVERLRERLDAAITDNDESLERARTVMAEQVRLLDASDSDDSDELADTYIDAIRHETKMRESLNG